MPSCLRLQCSRSDSQLAVYWRSRRRHSVISLKQGDPAPTARLLQSEQLWCLERLHSQLKAGRNKSSPVEVVSKRFNGLRHSMVGDACFLKLLSLSNKARPLIKAERVGLGVEEYTWET
jgi:hypothetical protein